MTPSKHGEVFATLADPTRREIAELLGDRGRASATELARELPVSRQAVVQHLGVLEAAGLASSRRQGQAVLYQLDPEHLDDAARWLADRAALWESRLDAVRRIAEGLDATGDESAVDESAGDDGWRHW